MSFLSTQQAWLVLNRVWNLGYNSQLGGVWLGSRADKGLCDSAGSLWLGNFISTETLNVMHAVIRPLPRIDGLYCWPLNQQGAWSRAWFCLQQSGSCLSVSDETFNTIYRLSERSAWKYLACLWRKASEGVDQFPMVWHHSGLCGSVRSLQSQDRVDWVTVTSMYQTLNESTPGREAITAGNSYYWPRTKDGAAQRADFCDHVWTGMKRD